MRYKHSEFDVFCGVTRNGFRTFWLNSEYFYESTKPKFVFCADNVLIKLEVIYKRHKYINHNKLADIVKQFDP